MVLAVDSKNRKRPIISIPSSPERKSSPIDDENEKSQEDEDGEVSEDEYDDDNDQDYEDSSNVEDDDGDDDDDDDVSGDSVAAEDLCERVIDLLKRNKSLDVLKLDQCKAYLRKHSLRLSGTKAACIERIQEHWRIKDRNGGLLYPKSSFITDCTGDVCKDDVVMFKQKVYSKFDKVTRGANVIGKRIVAGRIVKESYGSAKQQHTFTVEVLWSEGSQALPPLFPLLVKGRNLYRLKTFRQPWNDEAERGKVLDEKHKRGAAARYARAIARGNNAKKGLKRQKNRSTQGESRKRQRQAEIMPDRPNGKLNNHCETAPVYIHGMAKEYKTKFPGGLSSGLPTQTYQAASESTQFCPPSIQSIHGKAEKVCNKRFPDSSTSIFSEEANHHHGSEIYTQFSAPSINSKTERANSHGNWKDWSTKCNVSSSSGLSNGTYHYGNEIHTQFRARDINRNAEKVSNTISSVLSSSELRKDTHRHGTAIHNIQFCAPFLHNDVDLANSHGNMNWKTRFPGLLSGLWKAPSHHQSEMHAQFHAPSFHNGAHNHGSDDIHYAQIHAPSFHPGTAQVNNSPRKAKKVWNRRFPHSASSSRVLKETHYHGQEVHLAQYRALPFHH